MRARILSVCDECPECRRLIDMGLTVGAEFEVLRVAPLGDPVEISIRGYQLCVRRDECSEIEIEVIS